MLSDARLTWSSPTRARRSCHDSVNPCRACARSPTMVRLRDGQRSRSICHSASVSSWASSTTMWANGPASRSGSASAATPSSTRASRRSWPRSIDITWRSESSVAIRWSTTRSSPRARRRRRPRADADDATPRGRRAAAGPRRGAAGRTPSTRAGVPALQQPDLVGVEPGRAQPQVGGHRPQVARRGRSARSAATPCRRRRARSVLRASAVRIRSAEASSSSSCLSTRIVSSSSQTWSRASLCGVPGAGDSNASAQSSELSHTSDQGVSTTIPSLGGSS